MKRKFKAIGITLVSIFVVVALVIGSFTYVTEHSIINYNEPIIYIKVSQYKQLYIKNKEVFNRIEKKLEENKVDYSISLVHFRGIKSIEAIYGDKEKNKLQSLLKDKSFSDDLTFMAEKLKTNYIDCVAYNGLFYVFTRRDITSGHNDYIGIRYDKEPDSTVNPRWKIDENWHLFFNTDFDNYPLYRKVYDFIYNR